jgi:PII-like signaling protein
VLSSGPAKKVCIYVGEDQQYHGSPTYAAILDFLFYRGVSGATIVKGIAGFGADHHLHTTRILRLTEDLPIKIEFIETKEKVDEVMAKLCELAGTGLIDVHDTNIAKANKPHTKSVESKPPILKREGNAKLMRIYVGENDKWHDKPLHEALLQALRANDIAGVTVYRGIMGYGANRRIHGDKTLSISHDRPMMLSIVDTEEKLRAFLPVLDDMIQQGMVVLSDVDIIKYTHNSQTVERRKESR